MSTPPLNPNDLPQDRPSYPGPSASGPSQPGGPSIPGQQAYPGQQAHPGQPGQLAHPGQPGGYGSGAAPAYNPSQPGYNPYGGMGGSGYNYAPPGTLAGWGSRVIASILDSLLALIPVGIALLVALTISGSMEQMSDGASTVLSVGYIAFFLVVIWNRIIRQGKTGQSIGKKIVGLKIVGADSGQLIGIGRTIARELCAGFFNYFCFLNSLWPLWDKQQQTWHDKVASDLVIKL
ncbi:putative RDD family membrane protein YckC [Kribbella amoyensis]|uniref:Putative RDD family membrane protein YckC n=1 Tax=Kribbella amoyensis TaxID=996641 RepID=A0A561BRH9_9ACTN|nr:RDD family protein [Kribbella amoyensis]TWD81507.1 putative RDD family membrane protein YckC [Kribbella amoyensis]